MSKGQHYYMVDKSGKLVGATYGANPPVVDEGYMVVTVKPDTEKQKFDFKKGIWK